MAVYGTTHDEVRVGQSSPLIALQKELELSFEQEEWHQFSEMLTTVAQIGEGFGQKELCLKAQTLRHLMNNHSGCKQLSELFQELKFHLNHLSWKTDSEMGQFQI